MKFYNFMNENALIEFHEIQPIIKKNCSEILNVYKKTKKIFYRGIPKYNIFKKIVPKTNRKPLNTPIKLHKFIDSILFERFHWKPRSEGIFATSNYMVAAAYGNPYIFIPLNGYKFVYNKDVVDLYKSFKTLYISDTNIINDINKIKNDVYVLKMLNDYTNKNLRLAIINDVEIMFKCSAYYILSSKFEFEFMTWLEYL